jgi:hypothetical protein
LEQNLTLGPKTGVLSIKNLILDPETTRNPLTKFDSGAQNRGFGPEKFDSVLIVPL